MVGKKTDHFSKFDTYKGVTSGKSDVGVGISNRSNKFENSKIRPAAADQSESLSDVDDAEVMGYFHNKEEIHYKRIIWEAMNREYPKRQVGQKRRASEAKKSTSAKAMKIADDMENNKRLSSKINYDALKKLTEDLDESPGMAKIEGMDSDFDDAVDLRSDAKFSNEVAESVRENYEDELEHETDYRDDSDIFENYDENLYYQHEEGGFDYDEEYDNVD